MILRFYDVNEGRILIDGVDVRDYELVSLRKAMGLVMQEPTLFNYSVAENILYGNSDAYNSDIREASKIANAIEFVESHLIENAFDDSAEALINELKRNEYEAIKKMGKKDFDEGVELL